MGESVEKGDERHLWESEPGSQNRSTTLAEDIEEEGITITVSNGDLEYNLRFLSYDSEGDQEDNELVNLKRKDDVTAGFYESMEQMFEIRDIHQPDGVTVITTMDTNLEYVEEGEDYLYLEHAYEIIEEETDTDIENILTP